MRGLLYISWLHVDDGLQSPKPLGSASSLFAVISLFSLIIILGRLLFRLDNHFRCIVLGWTLLIISSPLAESANGEEAADRNRY